jgi:hypothetical protein
MLKESKMKEMTASANLQPQSELQIPSYLIQNLDNYNYLIHRELMNGEMRYYKSEDIFEYQGKFYIACVSNSPTEESAELDVKSYWRVLKTLKRTGS